MRVATASTLCVAVLAQAYAAAASKVDTVIAGIDQNLDGRITKAELSRYLRNRARANRESLEYRTSSQLQPVYEDAVKMHDVNNDGVLSLDEMLRDNWGPTSFGTTAATLRLMVAVADEDGNGKISPAEMLLMTHPDWSTNRSLFMDLVVARFIDDWDQNKDGLIDLPEFLESERNAHVDWTDSVMRRASHLFDGVDLDGSDSLGNAELRSLLQQRFRPDDWDAEASHMLNSVVPDTHDHNVLKDGVDVNVIRAKPLSFLNGIRDAARDEL
eukprot:g6953.t1